MTDFFAGLNPEQLAAAQATEGYVRVIAGAGTGKTKTLTARYAHLVENLGVPSDNILAITFTNKAAQSMKQKIRAILGENAGGYINTFHGFAVKIIKENPEFIHFPKSFIIIDEEDRKQVIKKLFKDLNVNTRQYTVKKALADIDGRKTTSYQAAELISKPTSADIDVLFNATDSIQDKIFYAYLKVQRQNFGLDFSDLLTIAMLMLNGSVEIREKWQKRLQYVMVDEYQDVSEMQVAFVELLADLYKNLFIVGDPDQTIYTWRGAAVNYILDFEVDHPDAQTVVIDKNYRSSSDIINVSNELIENNKQRYPKALNATKPASKQVMYQHAKTETAETEWVVNQIETLHALGIKYSDVAILYRANSITRMIEQKLIEHKTPYKVYSGMSFYQRKEIKDVLSFLRLIVNGDDLAFSRVINVPARGMGKKRLEKLEQYAELRQVSLFEAFGELITEMPAAAQTFHQVIMEARQKWDSVPVAALVTFVLERTGYEADLRLSGENDRLDNIAELRQGIVQYQNEDEEADLAGYLESVSLYYDEIEDEDNDQVKLMTIHASKGLEFPYVFVIGMSEGIFPSNNAKKAAEVEEERRVAYVAFTRAENALFLTDSEGYTGQGLQKYPSRFITEINPTNLEFVTQLPQALLDEATAFVKMQESRAALPAKPVVATNLLGPGMRVQHEFLGLGTIEAFDETTYIVKFDTIAIPRQINADKITKVN
ncbi:hypothetical protein EQG49_00935 [Periweissella cryptocerci]|uniref:DNA 3'-5' helicase n=1 Tax=Periweissella cryptocerci TaxID=2506420 RepID=A0A4P6YR61_9LACO|nr:3'-5' exonuclease [Periweissella cryptocerci]QBO35119.1 hypothetical protein EQG49_00935 [Periweissella cryptocerci]